MPILNLSKYFRQELGGHIIELTLLIPILAGSSISLLEAFNLLRAQSTLHEAVSFGTRELGTVSGQGVKLHAPQTQQRYQWQRYRKSGNTVTSSIISANSATMPASCTVSDSSNIGCTQKLVGNPHPSMYSKTTADTRKVLDTLVSNEIKNSSLPELNLGCNDLRKKGCVRRQVQYIAANNGNPAHYAIEVSYNAPLPFLGGILGRKFATLTARSTKVVEDDLRDIAPVIVNENVFGP